MKMISTVEERKGDKKVTRYEHEVGLVEERRNRRNQGKREKIIRRSQFIFSRINSAGAVWDGSEPFPAPSTRSSRASRVPPLVVVRIWFEIPGAPCACGVTRKPI